MWNMYRSMALFCGHIAQPGVSLYLVITVELSGKYKQAVKDSTVCKYYPLLSRSEEAGFSPGAGFRQAELKVHLLPATETCTSCAALGTTLNTRPSWPSDCMWRYKQCFCTARHAGLTVVLLQKTSSYHLLHIQMLTAVISSLHSPCPFCSLLTSARSSMIDTTSPALNIGTSTCRKIISSLKW